MLGEHAGVNSASPPRNTRGDAMTRRKGDGDREGVGVGEGEEYGRVALRKTFREAQGVVS